MISKYRNPVRGYHFLHTAIDAHSRLAYSELLADERKETAAAFWLRANAWFSECGITVRKVLTDNGSCYRSHTFRDALGDIEHRRTRPYRPQTNGKVERFHRTLADEWAYARLYTSDTERCAGVPTTGCTPTITTAATPHSAVNHPPAAYLTSQVSTPSTTAHRRPRESWGVVLCVVLDPATGHRDTRQCFRTHQSAHPGATAGDETKVNRAEWRAHNVIEIATRPGAACWGAGAWSGGRSESTIGVERRGVTIGVNNGEPRSPICCQRQGAFRS